jgi:hypothetical protein
MGSWGNDANVNKQGLHQFLDALLGVKTNRVEIGGFGRLELASGGQVIGFGLGDPLLKRCRS